MMWDNSCKGNHEEAQPVAPRALYIHVPFCRSKCRYCDFYSRPFDKGRGRMYVRAVRRELAARRRCLSLPLTSVFVGGGTATVLGDELLGGLLGDVHPLIDEGTEFTVEANPGTVTPSVAAVLSANRVNRVSLGAQSFDPGELWLLGRGHEAQEISQAVSTLREEGIENLSLDLIYGIPTQTLGSWKGSLEAALSLRPRHLSCFALSFGTGTAFEQLHEAGAIEPMDESLQRDCYFAAIDAAGKAGLKHYEMSNFALPGWECKHNLGYWTNEGYLGIGPGAGSYVVGVRRTNRPDLKRYIQAVLSGYEPPGTWEHLTDRPAMGEAMILGLRLTQGVDRKSFACRFGVDPLGVFPQTIARYAEQNLLVVTPSHVRLGKEGLFVADTILGDILSEL